MAQISNICHFVFEYLISFYKLKNLCQMPDEQKSVAKQISAHKSELQNCSNLTEKIALLHKINILVSQLDISSMSEVYKYLSETLKPIASQILNINIEQNPETIDTLEHTLHSIVNVYAKTVRFCFDINSFQLLLEFFSRNKQIFLYEGSNQSNQKQDFQWISLVIKQSQRRNSFFYKCINTVMETLSGIETIYPFTNISFIKEYFTLVYNLEEYLRSKKIQQCISKSIQSLEEIIINAQDYKQFADNLSYEIFQKFSGVVVKLLKYSDAFDLKKRAEQLGALHGLGLFRNPAIEKKLTGLKIINKWARHFYGGVTNSTKQDDFVQWLFDKQIIDTIFQDAGSSTMMKASTDIFRLLFRKKCLNLDNFQIVLSYVDRACSENRKIIFKYMDMESIRLDYRQYDFIISYFSNIKPANFYEQQMFMILDEIIKYSASKMLKASSILHGKILRTHLGKFKTDRIEYKCIKNLVRTIIKIVEKTTQFADQNQQILQVYDTYFNQPNRMGVLVLKYILDDWPSSSYYSKPKVAAVILRQRKIVHDVLQYLKREENDPGLAFDLEELLCEILKIVKDNVYSNQKIKFDQDLFYQATISHKIFQSLIRFLEHSSDFDQMFDTLVQKFNIQSFSFSCLRAFFYRINILWINKITEQYAEDQYQIICLPKKLKGFQNMKYLMLNTENQHIRIEIADFLSDLYTSYSENRMLQGEEDLIYTMKETKAMLLSEYETYKSGKEENLCRLKGYLAFVEALMKTTEVLGVGKLKAHNSLVATSTVKIKVFNQVTYGNDVLTAYEKKFPSNMTLFEFIEELSQQFKCSAFQIMFREGVQIWPQKWNGLTLQEVKADGKVLNAVKSFRNRIRKQALILDGEITPKARAAFEAIYNYFAPEGKMGKKQCAKYVAGVTNTSCEIQDSRVLDFFRQFDSDNDENITLEDFLKFYKQNSSSSRDEVVWKNLTNMRYRKDLKKFDQPIQAPHQELLFRSYLASTPEIYSLLHEVTKSDIALLRDQAMKLLFRLPTDPKALESLSSELDLVGKNCFETEYILIAIQSYLNPQDENIRKKNVQIFIQCGNGVKIFDMMLRINQFANPTKDQMKCMYISLQILRSLMDVPSLREEILQNQSMNLKINLPQTNLFMKFAENSLKNIDLDILQSSLALQLTQIDSDVFKLALEGVFNEESDIRKITCNYIFILYRLGKVKIDLFEVQPKGNSQFWFQMLVKIINIDQTLNYHEILMNCLKKVQKRGEDIQSNPEDQVIYGNLAIIQRIIDKQRVKKVPQSFVEDIIELAKRIISVRNRKMIYSILATQDLCMTLDYIKELLNSVQPLKEVSAKRYYVGLKNLGSTCYMNSILQVLFIIKEFRNLIFSLNDEEQSRELTQVNQKLINDDILFQLKKMYSYLQKSVRQYFEPEEFCLTIKDPVSGKPINPRIQEDAHQFVGNFLDKIEKYSVKSQKFDYFKQLIIGKTLTQFTCLECSNKISREQNFCQLPLEVKNLKQLKESLQKFIKPEEITEYFCQICDKKVQKIEKSTYLSDLPEILIINLQRIIFDLDIFQKVKVDSNFSFPESFNFYDFVSKDIVNIKREDCDYVLRGIVVHSGTSEAGHYYSIINDKNEWYKFNDQTVSKFDIKDLARQAFGGTDSQDNWSDELKFSTNAYILFYEKKKNKPISAPQTMAEEVSESDMMESLSNRTDSYSHQSISQQFQEEIQSDNICFFKQLQVHQQSIYEFTCEIFDKLKPEGLEQMITKEPYDANWQKNPNILSYEHIYDLIRRLIDFSQIFYHINNDNLFRLGTNIYNLFFLLPQKSYSFLTQLSVQKCIEGLCLHNDDTIRNIFKCSLNKAMHVFFTYYQLNFQSQEPGQIHFKKLIDGLFDFFFDERLFKNTYKLSAFFEFWNVNLTFIPSVRDYTIKKEIMVVLIDILMGNDSPLYKENPDKNKPKRQDIPQFQSIPILKIIQMLMYTKKNLINEINPFFMGEGIIYSEMTDNEKKMISNINFYKKMIKNRCDNGILCEVTAKLCYKDEIFSKKMVEIFLKGLNSAYDEVESSLIMIKHLKNYLLIDDEFTDKRLKWVLGIPQLEVCEEMNYGLKYQDQSVAFCFVSPLYFAQSDQYQPALHVLFMKRSVFSLFSVSGVILLLQLMCQSQKCLRYVMSLPAPTYLYRNYVDWIWDYICKLKEEESYYIQFDKNMYHNTLVQLYLTLTDRLKQLNLSMVTPVNKYIFGKNKDYQMRATYETPYFHMALWAHQTYYLENIPTGNSNKSLPKQLFKFADPSGFAKLFVSTYKSYMDNENDKKNENEQYNIPADWTIYTLHIETKQNLKLNFKFKNFKEEVVFLKGKVYINFPYEEFEGDISQYIEFEVQEEIKEEAAAANAQGFIGPAQQTINEEFPSIIENKAGQTAQFDFQKQCSFCTYINFGVQVCEMCQNALY